MTKRRLLVLLVGVIALGMVAHVVIAEDAEEGPRRGRGPRAGRGRPDGEHRGRPEGAGEGRERRGKPDGEGEGGERRGRPGGEGGRRPMFHRPISPLMVALDINKDGKLDKREIANASRALARLAGEKGVITREQLRPKRPEGGKGGERPEAGKGGKGGERRGRGRGRGRGEGEEAGKGRGPVERPE